MHLRSTAAAATAAAALLGLSSAASAQFLTSITRPAALGPFPPNMNTVDVFLTLGDGTDTFIYNPENLPSTAAGFGGLAADEAGRRFFGTVRNGPDDDLYSVDYDTRTPTLIGEIAVNGDPQTFEGLAYDTLRDTLYGTRRLGGSTGIEGLYTIDLATAAATLVFEYEAGSGTTSDFDISGIDYDPVTDRIYLADEDTTNGRNIYSFDPQNPSAGLLFVTEFGPGITDVDGLGAGDGKLFLLADREDANDGVHWQYDLATGLYSPYADTPYPLGAPSSLGPVNPSGGGAYAPGLAVPEPATAGLGVMGLGLLLARRRR